MHKAEDNARQEELRKTEQRQQEDQIKDEKVSQVSHQRLVDTAGLVVGRPQSDAALTAGQPVGRQEEDLIKDKENAKQEELNSNMSAKKEAPGKVKEAARRIEEKEIARNRKTEEEDRTDRFDIAEGDQ